MLPFEVKTWVELLSTMERFPKWLTEWEDRQELPDDQLSPVPSGSAHDLPQIQGREKDKCKHCLILTLHCRP